MARARRVTKLRAGDSLDRATRHILKARVKDVSDWSSAVDRHDATTDLHNLRIAVKRLRYTLELVQTILPPAAAEKALDATQEVQELAGQIHDDDVLIELLRHRCADIAASEALALVDTIRPSSAERSKSPTAIIELGQLPARVHGILSIIDVISRRREERYAALVQWWHAHPALMDELDALTRRKTRQAI